MPSDPDPVDPGAGPTPDADPDADAAADDLDEVGFAIGPDDGGGGLFDRTGTDVTGSGEHTASTLRENTREPPRRTALLAWLAADLPTPRAADSPDVTHPGPGVAPAVTAETLARLRAALRRDLADEAPDPLPSLDATAPLPELGGAATILADTTLADNEDTATELPRVAAPEDPSVTAPLPDEVLAALAAVPPPRPRPSPPDRGPSASAAPAIPPRPSPPGPRSPRHPIPGLAPLLTLVLACLAGAYFFFGGR